MVKPEIIKVPADVPKDLRFRTMFTPFKPRSFTFVLASLTVPDEALSIPDLLLNHTVKRLEPVFDENSKIRDPRSYDVNEILLMRRELDRMKEVEFKNAADEINAKRRDAQAAHKAHVEQVAKEDRKRKRAELVERQLQGR